MKREEVIEIATDAGFFFHDAGYAPTLHTTANEYSEKCFERLVAEVERRTIERFVMLIQEYPHWIGQNAKMEIITAIRALQQQEKQNG